MRDDFSSVSSPCLIAARRDGPALGPGRAARERFSIGADGTTVRAASLVSKAVPLSALLFAQTESPRRIQSTRRCPLSAESLQNDARSVFRGRCDRRAEKAFRRLPPQPSRQTSPNRTLLAAGGFYFWPVS